MQVLYEDPYIIVCSKEAGLPVQSASARQKDLESMLKTYLREKSGETHGRGIQGGEPYLGVVHRLDQPVRGLTVFARDPKSASSLSAQAAGTQMKKTYLAVVRIANADILPGGGDRLSEKRELSDLLIRDGRSNLSRIARPGEKGAKQARLFFRGADDEEHKAACRVFPEYEKWILGEDAAGPEEKTAVLVIELVTGRHHQIRVQLSHAGMPILGDLKYADGMASTSLLPAAQSGKHSFAGPALAAWKLEFTHPVTGKRCTFCQE